jgi:glycosyltransferase involved in cell wall biosynthesis
MVNTSKHNEREIVVDKNSISIDQSTLDNLVSTRRRDKIRVLLVITRMTMGSTNVVLDIASHLNQHPQFEVGIIAGPVPEYEVDLTHLAYENKIPTEIVKSLTNRKNPLLALKAFLELRAYMLHGRYDIVHTHSSMAGVIGRLAAYTARVPVIIHHVHGWGLQEGMSGVLRMLYLGLERLCASITDRMIAVSKPTIQTGLMYRICKEDKFALIYNGIHLEKFRQKVDGRQIRKDLSLDPEHKLVGMICRLDKQKNPMDFIRAAAIVIENYPGVQFLIAGDGPLRSECEDLIDNLNLRGKLFLLGFRSDIHRILPILSLTAMSSLWEGLPFVFQEAMSAGKPVVANDVDGVGDVVINGETGYLVPPHHPEEMAERILFLLKNDDLCQKMGIDAQRYSDRFSTQQMLEKIESLYKELVFHDDRVVRAGIE